MREKVLLPLDEEERNATKKIRQGGTGISRCPGRQGKRRRKKRVGDKKEGQSWG